MWHRFSPSLRQLVHSTNPPHKIDVFEQAYREALALNDAIIDADHLRLATLRGGSEYDALRRAMIKRNRAGRLRRAFTNLRKLYTIRRRLSIMHPAFVTDPYPMYDRLRAMRGNVHRDPLLGAWIVLGYAEAAQVFRDPHISAETRARRDDPAAQMQLPPEPMRRELCVISNVLGKMMVFNDPAAHSRMRTQIGALFPQRSVQDLRTRVEQVAGQLVDAVVSSGRMDLIGDFAYPLPLLVIANLIGFGGVDRERLRRWSRLVSNLISLQTSLPDQLACREALIEMRGHFDQAAKQSPLSDLIASPEADPDELFANVVFLLAAGHETTASVIGNGMRELLANPSQMKRLIDDPSLVGGAVEELLRMHSPVQWTTRRATDDIELAGQKIVKNSMLIVSIGAANRDPRQFVYPHRFDLARSDAARHLAFSGGSHFCLGAGLARVELQIAFMTLLRRLRNIRVQDGFKVTWRPGHTLHTFDNLPITFDRAE